MGSAHASGRSNAQKGDVSCVRAPGDSQLGAALELARDLHPRGNARAWRGADGQGGSARGGERNGTGTGGIPMTGGVSATGGVAAGTGGAHSGGGTGGLSAGGTSTGGVVMIGGTAVS